MFFPKKLRGRGLRRAIAQALAHDFGARGAQIEEIVTMEDSGACIPMVEWYILFDTLKGQVLDERIKPCLVPPPLPYLTHRVFKSGARVWVDIPLQVDAGDGPGAQNDFQL